MMQGLHGLRELLARLAARPDALVLELGAGGELLVARVRLVVAALLLLLPLANILGGGSLGETLSGLAGAVTINLLSLLWLQLARGPRRYRWLPFLTTAFDVSVVTLVLAMLAWQHPPAGLNSMVVWCCYTLAIMFTALRGDGRVSVVAGALALLQYGALVIWIITAAASPERLLSSEYGLVTLGAQAQRLTLLGLVTAVTAVIAFRMQQVVLASGHDGLTGLPNRTWLVHRAPALLAEARVQDSSLSLALLNLDGLRRINEQEGEHAGDRAICHAVDVIRGLSGRGEWLVRLGGDELLLVLQQPAGTAWERLDAIRRGLSTLPFLPGRGSTRMHLSFSAGIAAAPGDGRTLAELLRRADRRLRQAKLEGGNRVIARDD
ncbi:GGDEF domain-containing protein [Lysobacter sp. GX 14042]|uniref:GGDEF domain-containing protein n=1 Tax=Lysobacter sp. GX 14042 TaxID=2907155 RepID=UPI001F20E771|nr:GGDEF domain-containing protein [Lysobacter sp. GX 14042]MCE7031918.1 GGDEF domain-containing protein [Lysobacter sp. GX 14042]